MVCSMSSRLRDGVTGWAWVTGEAALVGPGESREEVSERPVSQAGGVWEAIEL